MKKLFIIRHAKSDQGFFGPDFDRPLNKRGMHDAPMMAEKLKLRQPLIDAFISSPANRAKTTAGLFHSTYNANDDTLLYVKELYHAPAETFYNAITAIDDRYNSVALFAHNPGITYFINSLHAGTAIDNMPTCGVFAVSASIHRWRDFAVAKKDFLFFDYPKLMG